MANFDLSKYETVKQRKKRFYGDHPEGRIIVNSKSENINEYAFFEAKLYETEENQLQNTPLSTGYAHEIREKELSKTKYNKEYASVNYTSWVENCEESAIGRALDNAGYAGNDKCSREEMNKVERKTNQTKPPNAKTTPIQKQKIESKKVISRLEQIKVIEEVMASDVFTTEEKNLVLNAIPKTKHLEQILDSWQKKLAERSEPVNNELKEMEPELDKIMDKFKEANKSVAKTGKESMGIF